MINASDPISYQIEQRTSLPNRIDIDGAKSKDRVFLGGAFHGSLVHEKVTS